MNKYRKEYCEENGRVQINPENTKLYDYIKHLEIKLAKAEQLNLSGVVGSLITLDEVGNKFKVIANTSGHDFYVGETVTLLGITEDEEDEYKFQVKKDHWWCGFADVKRL